MFSVAQQTELVVIDVALVSVAAIGYFGWQLRGLNRNLDSVKEPLAQALAYWGRHIRLSEAMVEAQLTRIESVAKTIVFARTEIFPASAENGSHGVAVFGIRNVGNEAVFSLGVTRTESDGPPSEDAVSVLGVLENIDNYLTLEHDGPAVVLGDIALWYRDLSGRLWVRRYLDQNARLVETTPAPAEAEASPTAPHTLTAPTTGDRP